MTPVRGRAVLRPAVTWAVLLAVLLAALPAAAQSPLPSASPLPTGTPGAPCLPVPGPSVAPDPSSPPAASAVPLPSTAASPVPSPAAPCPETGAGTDPRVEAALAMIAGDDAALVGQLLLLSWDGRTGRSARATLRDLRPGGLVFVANASRAAKARAINRGIADGAAALGLIPPLRAIDHEGGIVQRIRDVPNLGANADFAATHPSVRAACERGAAHAAVLREMGFDMDLAPVLDVVTDPRNTVIGDRSYGRSPGLVGRLGSAYIRGLQGGGIAASAKHFPGHGSTSVDSHLGLPVIPGARATIERRDVAPFLRAIEAGVASVMIGHLAVPAFDRSGTPATLSRPIVTGYLRGELGFDGLVVSDDLGAMDAITDRYDPGDAAVRAIRAGVDLLIIVRDGDNQVASRDALLAALRDGSLPRARVIEAVRHVLAVKAAVGLLDGVRPPVTGCGAA